MNFQSSKDASSFIDAIRHVCPCKANPPTQPALARASTMAAPAPSPRTPASAASSIMPPPPVPPSSVSGTTLRASATMAVDQRRRADDSPSSQRMAVSSLITTVGSEDHARTESVADAPGIGPITAPRSTLVANTSSAAPSLSLALGSAATVSASGSRVPISGSAIASSPGAYTQPAAAATPQTISPVPPTVHEAAPSISLAPEAPRLQSESQVMDMDTSDDTLVAPLLPKIPGIYDLAGTELESLVAGVVREDGFVKLVGSLRSWRKCSHD